MRQTMLSTKKLYPVLPMNIWWAHWCLSYQMERTSHSSICPTSNLTAKKQQNLSSFRVKDSTYFAKNCKQPKTALHHLAPLVDYIKESFEKGGQCLITCDTEQDLQRTEKLLGPYFPLEAIQTPSPENLLQNNHKLGLVIASIEEGFEFGENGLSCIPSSLLFGSKKRLARKKDQSWDDSVSDVNELKTGDPVVHIDHGVGIFKGLEKIDVRGVRNDFIRIEYLGGDKLFLPVYRLKPHP